MIEKLCISERKSWLSKVKQTKKLWCSVGNLTLWEKFDFEHLLSQVIFPSCLFSLFDFKRVVLETALQALNLTSSPSAQPIIHLFFLRRTPRHSLPWPTLLERERENERDREREREKMERQTCAMVLWPGLFQAVSGRHSPADLIHSPVPQCVSRGVHTHHTHCVARRGKVMAGKSWPLPWEICCISLNEPKQPLAS